MVAHQAKQLFPISTNLFVPPFLNQHLHSTDSTNVQSLAYISLAWSKEATKNHSISLSIFVAINKQSARYQIQALIHVLVPLREMI